MLMRSSFLRTRFNWPSDVPELRMDEETEAPKTTFNRLFHSNSHSNSSSDAPLFSTTGLGRNKRTQAAPIPRDINNMTPVRSFKVFKAVKLSRP
jgi:hypothetical protein